jgi:uncharacterized membrane protein YqjE
MASQTQVNGAARRPHAAAAFRENISSLLHDVIELGELQSRLFAVDLNEARRGALLPALLVFASLFLAAASVPIALLGIGWALVEFVGWSHAVAFAVTAGGALLVAGATAWLGWRLLTNAVAKLARSRNELATNVSWIKNALKSHDSSASRKYPGSIATHDSTQERKSLS